VNEIIRWLIIMGFHEKRIERLKNVMESRNVDALILMKPQNQFYLSDFNPIIFSSPTIVVTVLNEDPVLLVPHTRLIHAEAESRIKDIQTYGAKDADHNDPMALITKLIDGWGLNKGRIGIENPVIPVDLYHRLRNGLIDVTIIDAAIIIDEMKMVKDSEEIQRIQIASKLADKGMEAAVDTINERTTEVEVTNIAVKTMLDVWANQYPEGEISGFGGTESYLLQSLFASCTSGIRINRRCDAPLPKKFHQGEFALPVISAIYKGYHSEIERTIAVGTLNRSQKKTFEAILEARQASMDLIRPGVRCSEVHEAARMVIEKNGFLTRNGYHFADNSGHSIGLGTHEKPGIQENDDTYLQAGMVVAIEPALYSTEFGGVRHSDTLLVTDNGFTYLTSFDHGFLMK